MVLKTKSRNVQLRPDMFSSYRRIKNGVTDINQSGFLRLKKYQITDTEGHPWHYESFKGVDKGGDFTSVSRYIDPQGTNLKDHYIRWDTPIQGLPGQFITTGPFLVAPVNPFLGVPGNGSNPLAPSWSGHFPGSLQSSDEELLVHGATAIARCKPTSSPASLSVTLGELFKDGLPSLPGSSFWKDRLTKIRKDSGGEYLNVVFGWQPFISDVKQTVNTVNQWDSLLDQYERDSGRLVRRRYEFPIERESEVVDLGVARLWRAPFGAVTGELSNTTISSAGSMYVHKETYVRRWFSGAFTYHLPSDYYSRNSVRKAAAEAKILLGLELTPETVWNLAPWSWAIDWFSNAGDVLSTVSDFASDGLVMPYGYIMEHTLHRWTYTAPNVVFKNGLHSSLSTTVVHETKVRRKASPFGFGLTWEGLTPRQLSILAALGISRS